MRRAANPARQPRRFWTSGPALSAGPLVLASRCGLAGNYRESVLLQPAADSFRRGWAETQGGDTMPVERLWEGVDVE